jgi:gliding motility-associated-like protein
MNWTATPKTLKRSVSLFLNISVIVLTLFYTKTYAQTKNYAEIVPSQGTVAYYGTSTDVGSTGAGSITSPGNAAIATPSNPATLSVNYFNILGLIKAEGEAWIELKYAAPVTAGKTTYIRFDQPTSTGLSLDLLNALGGLTGLLQSNLVQVEAYTGADAGNNGTKIADANVTTTVVRSAAGQNFFAVSSSNAYNAVRIRLRYRGGLLGLSLGASINLNVYTAFNYDADNCGTSIFTNIGEKQGVNVSLTDAVMNPERAIDGDLTTFSQLQPGIISLGSSVSQTIYLNGLSSSGDAAKIILSQPGTLLSADVFKTITLQAYNGNTAVGTVQLVSNLIDIQLLTALSNSNRFPVFLNPGGAFDRVKITVNNALSVGGNLLSGGLNVHEVQRTVTKPAFAGSLNGTLSICGGSNLTLSALNPNSAYTYNFYKKTTGARALLNAATTGTITETGLTAGTYTYYIAAQKSGCTGESDLDSVTVTVKPQLVFPATTLTRAIAGTAYVKQITAATGGTPGYTYALAAGSTLPAGLTISAAGLITGTPATAGTFNFDLTATDSFGCKVTATYTLTVTVTLVLPAAVLPGGTVGVPYPSTLLPSPTGGTTPYTFAAVNLPAGLSLNPATGEITGTPTTQGTFTFPVTVTDADGNTVTASFTIVVRNPLVLSPATLSDGTVGVSYPAQIIPVATGGSGIYTYTAPNLPPGLSFNPATREITGIPSQSGSFSFPVTVSDNEGRTATADYTIVVRDLLVLGPKTLADGTVGVNYPEETLPAASGGTGPYTYVATNLPPGLTFDAATRVISGTPTQSGSFTVSVKVTDNANASLTVPYTIRVNGLLGLAAAVLPAGTVGAGYTSQALPEVTGGTAPYTYAMSGLPARLTFDPATRIISGTPEAGGNFTVTMSASDSGGLTTSTDYILNVTVSAPVIASAPICSGGSATLSVSSPVAGVTYNFYSATGNTPLSTGNTLTTGPLSTTTTYYAEAVSGTAVSARIPVTVTVNPAPQPPVVTTNNETVSTGQTVMLQATADPGASINWYTAATGGTPVASGVTFTTGILTATTTYYAGTTNGSGCESLTRVPVTVTVTDGPVNPNCNAATTQQSRITGLLCIACSIQGPANSTDADLTNYTEISIVAGVGAAGYQRLIFQRPGAATDSIRLDLETPVGLLDLSALGGITINVMNGNTVVSSSPINQSLVSLHILGGNRFAATVLAGGVYDRVEVRFNPVVAALSNVRIYGAEVILPNPVIVAGGQTICSGTTANLSATPQGGTTLTWYSDATGGSILANGNTYLTPQLTTTTTYYIQVSLNGCANLTRVPVTVTVTPPVTAPVLAVITPVCIGSSAVLAIDNPQTGVTYSWYTDPTGGTAVFTGEVITIPGLTTAVTYYAEASNGNCISVSRTAANITVSPRPVIPQIQASVTTVNIGQTTRLTATSTETDVIFNWYDAANATTPVFTGPDYITPPLSVTTTFYVEATSTITGCASSARVQQTITVNGNGTPIPVDCETPVSQTNGVDGILSVLARVNNPVLAIDGDQQTGSTLSIPLGIGSSVFQRVRFTGLSNVGDTVRVLLTSTGQLLSAAVLPSVTLTTYNDQTSNNDAITVSASNPLIKLELLSAGRQALLSFVPSAQFDGVELRLNSGLLSALTAINFNYARRIIRAPEVVSANVATCVNTTATLTVANPQTANGVTYKWYDAAGVFLADGETYTTLAITADTKFFVEAVRGGCMGSRTVVNVTINPAPPVPVLLSATEQTCLGSNLVFQVQNPQAGVTFQWYKDNILIPGATAAAYNEPSISGGAVYSVEAINSCGTSAKATVTVTIGALTPPVITPPAVTINSGESTILTASSSTTGLTYAWYAEDPGSNPTTPLVSTPGNGEDGIFTTPALSATTTYYVIATNTVIGGCQSVAASVIVTVATPPVNPGSVPCEPGVSQTTDKGGLSILSFVSNPALAADNDIETSSSLVIPVGIGSFISQKVAFTGSSQIGDKVRLRLTSPSKLISVAVLPSVTVTTYNNGVSNGDERIISNPLISLQLLDNGGEAMIEFTPEKAFDAVEVKLNSGLLGALTSINFNYAQRIISAPAVQSAAVTACEGGSASLAVTNPVAGTTYNWYLDNVPLVSADIYQTPVNLAAGTYNYSVSASRGGCEGPKTAITVTIAGIPLPPVAASGNPVTTCLNTPVTLNVDPVTGVSYNWYDAMTGGNLLAANTGSYTTGANLTAGTTDFYVEAVNTAGCANTSVRTKISVTINPAATTADLAVTGMETAICLNGNAILTASSTTVTNAVFTWYTDAALANPVHTGDVFNITGITAARTYYVTVRGDNRCENTPGTARVVNLTVKPAATSADITVTGLPSAVCAGTTVSLTASTTTVTAPVFNWYTDAALTNRVHTGDTYAPVITATTTYYVTVEGTDKCQNSAGDAKVVPITINPPATAADIAVSGIPSNICNGSGASLVASSTTVINPVFTWYTDAALTNPVATGSTYNITSLVANATYYVTVRGFNKCENTAANAYVVTLSVNNVLVFNGATLNAAVSSAYNAQISPASGGTPGYSYTLAAGSTLPAGLSLSASGILSGTPAAVGTYTFNLVAIDSKGCTALATFTLIVGVPATPVPVPVVPDGTACPGSSITLNVSNPADGTTYNWYTTPTGGNILYTGANYLIQAVTATVTYYVEAVTATGTSVRTPVTVSLKPAATAADLTVTGAPSIVCAGSGVTLTASSTTVANPVFTWYTDATLSNATHTGAIFNIPALSANTTYYVTVQGLNKCENTAATANIVVLNVNPALIFNGTALTNASTAADYSVQLSAATGGTPGYTYGLAPGSTLPAGLSLSASGVLSGRVTAEGNYTFSVTVTDSRGCTATASFTLIAGSSGTVVPAPVVTGTESCSGSGVTINITAPVSGFTYNWYATATGGSILYTGTNFQTPAVTATTNYYVEAVSGNNTSIRTQVTVTVLAALDKPVATVQSSTLSSITFSWNAVTGASGYEVSVNGGTTWTNPSSGATGTTHIVSALLANAKVTLLVRAKGTLTCQTSTAGNIEGTADGGGNAGNEIYIPNTFTPNGDGKNDVFYVYGNAIAKVQMRIYNQWGQFIYESLQLQNGWDGTFKGQVQPNGVYVYYIDLVLTDGTKTRRKGTITLLR